MANFKETSPPLPPLANCAYSEEKKEKERRDEAFDPLYEENRVHHHDSTIWP
jgi:hypothetical protein